MRTNTMNRRAAGFAAAVTAALALAACGPADAPSVAAPSVPPTSASSAPSGSSSAPSSDPSSSAPTPSSSGTSVAGAVCKTTSSIGPTFTASVPTKAFGTTVQVTDDLNRSVEISPSKPRQIAAGENSYLDPGMQFVAVDVRAHLVKGYSLYMSYIAFNLYDAEKRICYRTSSSGVMSEDQQLRGTTLNSTTTDTNGAVLFQVPIGADLNTFTLGFTSSLNDVAQAQWKG